MGGVVSVLGCLLFLTSRSSILALGHSLYKVNKQRKGS